MMADIETIRDELEKVRLAAKDKRLRPKAALEYARRHKDSALHRRLTWDNEEAGDLYRLEEIRRLIRVAVTVIETEYTPTVVSVREYVSLSDNRDDGYECLVDVMDDAGRSQVLLQDVIQRLLSIKETAIFEELAGVHKAIQKAAANHIPREETKEKPTRIRVETLRA